jgi:polar amino acid transport system permease protein
MTPSGGIDSTVPPDEIRAIPVRHPGRWVASVVVAYIAVCVIAALVTNPNFEWSVVWQNMTEPSIIQGLILTLELTAGAMAIGIVFGTLLAVMRLSADPLVRGLAWTYVWFFRGTPVLVQIFFWYFIAALFPTIAFGLPFGGPQLFHVNLTPLITQVVAGLLALGLNEAAYFSEIVRAGIISVDEGQTEAAHALGMTRLLTMRRIVLPQAMRVIIPPAGNETISMLKTSALVATIAAPDLFYAAKTIYARTYQTIPLLIVASIWYLIFTTILSIGQYYVERYYARGTRNVQPSLLEIWGRGFRRLVAGFGR